ncbi:MAG: hypothetical protein Kow0089_09370 [Desulfobulbaceae bacterium]
MARKIVLVCCCAALISSGCAVWPPYTREGGRLLEPLVVFPSFSSNYLLSCLADMETVTEEEFATQIKLARTGMEKGRNLDRLRFICLSLNRQADYSQFVEGVRSLDRYVSDHSDSLEAMQGLQVLVRRLEEEIRSRRKTAQTLTGEKNRLEKEVESLRIRLDEQQKQLEQLKNIETILKSRESSQP